MGKTQKIVKGWHFVNHQGHDMVVSDKHKWPNMPPCVLFIGEGTEHPRAYSQEDVKAMHDHLTACLQYIDKELKHLREMEEPRPVGEIMVQLIAKTHGIILQP